MIISGKYELNQPLFESGFQSFHARHLVTGREVMVHLLTGPGSLTLPELMASLNAERQAQVLDAGEYEGTSYLVTVPVAGFTTLRAWLAAGAPPAPQLGQTARLATLPAPAEPAGGGSNSEFTAYFGAQPAAGNPGSGSSQPGKPAGNGAAEISFTQMFEQPGAPPLPPRAPAPSPLAPAQPQWGGPAPSTSFTEIFRETAPATPAPPSQPGPLSPPSRPGSDHPAGAGAGGPGGSEFTRFFQLPEQPSRPPQPSTPNPTPAPRAFRPTTDSGASEFTEFFRGPGPEGSTPYSGVRPTPPPAPPPAPLRPQAAAAPPPPSTQVGGATEFFRSPLRSSPPVSSGAPTLPPAGGGVSEFTMIVGGSSGAPAPASSASPLVPPAGSPPPPPVPWPSSFPAVPAPAAVLPKMPVTPQLPVAPARPTWSLILVALLSAALTLGLLAIIYLASSGKR